MVAAAVVGWSNNATYWTVGGYMAYWWTVCAGLFGMKRAEGRAALPWEESAKAKGKQVERLVRS